MVERHSKRTSANNKHRAPQLARRACSLYTSPKARSRLPVFQNVTLQWDSSCVNFSSPTIDLYLSVVTSDSGLSAVHVWEGVDYADGSLVTQLKPSWWNASTGAGAVVAQLGFTASGAPLWDTAAPSGPAFNIVYNGSYPTSSQTASRPAYTGPSVESVDEASRASASSLSGGRLAAAVSLPLLALAALLGAYLAWHKLRKRPEKKRWSAVIDQRMSMVSEGTWRPSASISSRPNSHYNTPRRPAGSVYSNLEDHRRSALFTRPASSHSNAPSPLSSELAKVLPLAEMRQIGAGERFSRVSFATVLEQQRPTSSPNLEGAGRPTRASISSIQYGARSSQHSRAESEQSPLALSSLPRSPSSTPQSPGMLRTSPSQTSSLRQLMTVAAVDPASRMDDEASPDIEAKGQETLVSSKGDQGSEVEPPVPRMTDSHMPVAFADSVVSPDQALASYAGQREAGVTSPFERAATPPVVHESRSRGIARSASALFTAPTRMLRTLTAGSLTSRGPGHSSQPETSPSPEAEEHATGFSDETHERDPYAEFDEKGDEAAPVVVVGLDRSGPRE